MLARLYIRNYALIREMEVTFPGRLTVITGETGAGKSIFLEALGLALGRRADLAVADNKNEKCIVEAEFDIRDRDPGELFDAQQVEADSRIILRREISPEGRSRSFVNDSPVPLSVLKEFAGKLIDIHSQHQTLKLNDSSFQLDLLDGFAGTTELRQEYKTEYNRLSRLNKELEQFEEEEINAGKEQGYNEFLFNELDETAPEPGTLERLQEESKQLAHAEEIKAALLGGGELLSEGEENVLTTLARVKQGLSSISKYSERFSQLSARIESAYVELKDLSGDLQEAGSAVHFDDARLDTVSASIDGISKLMKKHRAATEEELLEIKSVIGEKLRAFGSLEEEISRQRKKIKECRATCMRLAGELSDKRRAAVAGIETATKAMLSDLSMADAVFKIGIEKDKEVGSSGIDRVSFLFSANKGVELAELQKIASGGELSRLMLCLKSLLAGVKKLPTIIFDEIDTGVSGEVAARIGSILHRMCNNMQLITITHLPQMASRGDHHLFVFKKVEGQRTNSYIRQLTAEERIGEIAKMLSAGSPGESALQNARELLSA